ncbi:LuxR C-terminal-related transcriptional regulator [Mesorhizobium helmanticense]|uniref:HTH luxR-type domain-containing protein n=1 Tax=Mesorhizobium helmanticense TaxID=1776423 RepID=A0A2T4IR89_9HYPH|nr:LuxR C-terminal-related transcriptional regulator [Mesorhizobium helmanticense]PTE08149.1 hypothetical protein C9427_22470 [Mesorhizobium helmanticense]
MKSDLRLSARPFLANRRIIPPRIPLDVVGRPRLNRIAGLLTRYRLTLVHAPAGSGKTTLLSQWYSALKNEGTTTAWYSVSDDERDPLGLADYLTLVMSGAAKGQSARGLPMNRDEAVARLLGLVEEATAQGPVVLFIDDYHLADENDASATIIALLDAEFPQFGIVLASRTRPSLALGRYRAHGEMIEISVDQLQFSADETADFFRAARGVELSPDESRMMRQHTEGWAAGLRLASLVLGRDGDRNMMASAPPGSHRAFADYFLEEVLSGLPEHIIDFLVETCILETLSGELCDMLTGRTDSAGILEHLEEAQLFIVALPGQQRWYRYHHLFQEFLYTRLLAKGDARIDELHRKAADWFIGSGSPVEAVRHAFLAHQSKWAAELIERYCVYDYLSHGRFELYFRWMQQLPREAREARPLLMFLLVWRHINGRRFPQAEQTLATIELSAANPDGECAAILRETGLDLSGRLHLMRALIGAYGGDLAACRSHIDAIGERELDHLAFGQVDLDSIHSYLAFHEGALEAAERLTWKASGVYDDIACHWGGIHSRCIAAMAYMARGLPGEAEPVLIDALANGESYFSEQSYMVALPSALLGMIAYEKGDFERAEKLWMRAMPPEKTVDVFGLCERVLIATIGLSRLYDATGRVEAADALFVRASRRAYEAEDFRLEFQLALERADRAFRQGRSADGIREMERFGTQLDEARARFPASIWQIWESHLIVDARALAARGQTAEAVARLAEGSAQARAQNRQACAILMELLQVKFQEQSGISPAEDRRVVLAAQARRAGLQQSLADLVYWQPAIPDRAGQKGTASATSRTVRQQSEPLLLTPREYDVLELMRQGLSNREIGTRLHINLNTVKSHAKNIFEKLQVKNRTQAVLKILA